jgi:hypothetical protein
MDHEEEHATTASRSGVAQSRLGSKRLVGFAGSLRWAFVIVIEMRVFVVAQLGKSFDFTDVLYDE